MLSIGILTFSSPDKLREVFESFKNGGLFDLSDDVFCVIQLSALNEHEKMVCIDYGVRPVMLPYDGNVAYGYKHIYEEAKCEYVLAVENIFMINKNREYVKECIDFVMSNVKRYDYFKLWKDNEYDVGYAMRAGELFRVCLNKYCRYSKGPSICSKRFYKHNILPYLMFECNHESDVRYFWDEKRFMCCICDIFDESV